MHCQEPGCDKPAKKRARSGRFHQWCGKHLYQHTQHHLPQKRKRAKEVKDRLKQEVFIAYSTGGIVCCKCCGEDNLAFLVLDHVNNDGAKHRESILASKDGRRSSAGGHIFYRWLRENGFPTNPPLQILCANCNMGKAGNDGVCPHVTNRTVPIGSAVSESSSA